jgi:N-acetylmuramoyl-L-alanine amidase
MTKIFIDPGHGGSDPGAVGNGLQEKNLTLTISHHIRDILVNEYSGVEVKMSRDSDVFIGLSQRTNMANTWRADYFLSVHINAGGGTGFESFIHTTRTTGSIRAQDIIHPAIINAIDVTDRGEKTANFAVIRETNMPAILTENLFIDNSKDASLLRDSNFLQRVARGHATGIAKAFNLQRKVSPPSSPNSPITEAVYRVIVDGKQVGAYSQKENILDAVNRNIGTANEIIIQRV